MVALLLRHVMLLLPVTTAHGGVKFPRDYDCALKELALERAQHVLLSNASAAHRRAATNSHRMKSHRTEPHELTFSHRSPQAVVASGRGPFGATRACDGLVTGRT